MDYLSLFAAGRLLSLRTAWLRSVAAAAVGALYGVIAVVLQIGGIGGAVLTAAVSALMCVIAFGVSEGPASVLRAALTVWGCGALLGGIMTAFSGMFGGVVQAGGADIVCAAAAVLFALIRMVRRRISRGYAEIGISCGGQTWRGRALIDSGNLLTDPIGGHPVVLLRAAEARQLLGTRADTLFRGQTEDADVGIRAVPVRTAEGTRLLYGFLCRDLSVRCGRTDRRRCAVVCVDHGADPMGGYGGCAALLPASLIS